MRKYRDKPRETNLSFFSLFCTHALLSPRRPGSATTSATADASYATTLLNARIRRRIRRRRSRKLSNKERGTNLSIFVCPSG